MAETAMEVGDIETRLQWVEESLGTAEEWRLQEENARYHAAPTRI